MHNGTFLLVKSDRMFARPERWLTVTWYLLTKERKVVTLGLDANPPRHNFSKPCTHGLLSVKTFACSCDYIIKGLKCLTLAAIESASISHGSHDTWCVRSLAPKKPAPINFPSRCTYIVAPIPCFVTDPSVTIHNWSLRLGKLTDLRDSRAFWAAFKWSSCVFDHTILSVDFSPLIFSSRGAIKWEHCGSTRLSIL